MAEKNLQLSDVFHRNFKEMRYTFEEQKLEYHRKSIDDISKALKECYGDRDISGSLDIQIQEACKFVF